LLSLSYTYKNPSFALQHKTNTWTYLSLSIYLALCCIIFFEQHTIYMYLTQSHIRDADCTTLYQYGTRYGAVLYHFWNSWSGLGRACSTRPKPVHFIKPLLGSLGRLSHLVAQLSENELVSRKLTHALHTIRYKKLSELAAVKPKKRTSKKMKSSSSTLQWRKLHTTIQYNSSFRYILWPKMWIPFWTVQLNSKDVKALIIRRDVLD
jgi:hypothetical protein